MKFNKTVCDCLKFLSKITRIKCWKKIKLLRRIERLFYENIHDHSTSQSSSFTSSKQKSLFTSVPLHSTRPAAAKATRRLRSRAAAELSRRARVKRKGAFALSSAPPLRARQDRESARREWGQFVTRPPVEAAAVAARLRLVCSVHVVYVQARSLRPPRINGLSRASCRATSFWLLRDVGIYIVRAFASNRERWIVCGCERRRKTIFVRVIYGNRLTFSYLEVNTYFLTSFFCFTYILCYLEEPLQCTRRK